MRKKLLWSALLLAAALQCRVAPAATANNGALWRPRFATPAFVALDTAGNRQFTAEVRASSAATGWSLTISNDLKAWTCPIASATYSTINRDTEPGWLIRASVPQDTSPELFTLVVSNSESISVQSQSVSVVPNFTNNFYILHMADEQVVQEFHNSPSGEWYDQVGTAEEFNWEKEPINLINPRFVMATGDHIDFNGALDKYNNWSNWGYQPGGTRYFSQQETSAIEAKLASLYFSYHQFRVPYVECPGNHDVPPTDKYLAAPAPPYVYWHSIGASFYETNWGQRTWSFRMGDFYVLMHDWSESSLKTWAASDYTAAQNDPTVKFRLIGQHFNSDQAYLPSSCDLMLVGHGHTTATLQSSPYYIYEDGPAFNYGTCGFFNFKRASNDWTCDQTVSARTTSKDVWPLYTDNGAVKKVRSNRSDAMNVTANSITITNDLPQNFYDGRVRFLMSKGTYVAANGTILAQYDYANGTKTAVLVKVNIPASGTLTVSIGPASVATTNLTLDPQAFGSRLKLTFSGYNRGEPLYNFPALVTLGTNLPGFSYARFASRTGWDLRFADATGTNALLHEIDEWNTNGLSTAWVQLPVLAGPSTSIWAYWGNPANTNPPVWTTNGAVWAPDHTLVWHLKESGLPYADSTLQSPALSGRAPGSTAGLVGLGGAFDGSQNYLASPAVTLGSAFTLSALVKIDFAATNIQTILANKAGGWNTAGFALYVDSYNTSDQQLRLETGDGSTGLTASTPAAAVSFGQWHHLAAVADRVNGVARLYVDGVDRTQDSAIVPTLAPQAPVNLARLTNSTSYLKGILDEVRIEGGARSSNWLWATYMSTASNAAFTSYSTVTQQVPSLSFSAASAGPVLTWPGVGVGFSLYATTNLTPPIVWTPVTNPAILTNNQWQTPAPNGSNSTVPTFYRLQSP